MYPFSSVHCVGIGGIHVSAVARLLKARGIRVSGSDTVESDEVQRLRTEGIHVAIGHAAVNVPAEVEAVVYSDAVSEENPERVEAVSRGIPLMDSHRFLGQLFADAQQIVITGTHGKSTTTAMVGKILEAAGENPTVVVGTRVPGWEHGNVRIGREDVVVLEGDEFKSHVLSYHPTVLAITNVEWDHPDIFQTEAAYRALFKTAESQARTVVRGGEEMDVVLKIPGAHNRKNAALAWATVHAYRPEIAEAVAVSALRDFPGVWRRFEHVGQLSSAPVISDYGHHPTEIRETLKAAREAYPDRRIVLCYQPHQRARTKQLFSDFLPVLAEVDVLILAEIYEVPGREEAAYADVSSQQLLDALPVSDRLRSYAADLVDAERQIRQCVQPSDLILVMGAGTIDRVARNLVA